MNLQLLQIRLVTRTRNVIRDTFLFSASCKFNYTRYYSFIYTNTSSFSMRFDLVYISKVLACLCSVSTYMVVAFPRTCKHVFPNACLSVLIFAPLIPEFDSPLAGNYPLMPVSKSLKRETIQYHDHSSMYYTFRGF